MSSPETPAGRLERNAGLIVLALLLLGCLIVLRPFLSALLWAVVLCSSSWPIYRKLLSWLGGRRTLAALAMTAAMLLVVLLPFVVAGVTLGNNVRELTEATRSWVEEGPPGPPAWVGRLPVVGEKVETYWLDIVRDSSRVLHDVKRFIEPVSTWVLQAGLMLGRGLIELALSIFIAFFLFRDGTALTERLATAVERLAGARGRHLLRVAANTIRGVVYGILGTGLVQAAAAGVGFLVAGVPGAALLALLTFFFSVLPMGPPLIWVPAALWLFNHSGTGWGIFMLVWGIGVSSVDNLVKPWLISQGSDMPFLLIFFGVLGGALAFGFIGVFLGPTLLAVGYRLVEEWAPEAQSAGGATAGTKQEAN